MHLLFSRSRAGHQLASRPLKYAAWCACLGLVTAIPAGAQPGNTASLKNSVLLNATVGANAITLTAPAYGGTNQYKVYRKLRSAASFPAAPLATIPVSGATALNYVDNGVSPQVMYEYKVVRTANTGTAYGYLCSGIQVPASAWTGSTDHYMGKVLVFVESGLAGSLGPALQQLTTDLKAEGWAPVLNITFSSASDPAALHTVIVNAYNSDPAHVKAVLLIGHVAVPVTQNNSLQPDGHSSANRLWPADGYFGDVNGTWTKHTSGPYTGKFNMAGFPSAIELAVGRVDLSDLPAFTASEAQLTNGYLQRLHAYRTREIVPKKRGIIFDALYWTGDAHSGGGWKSIAPLVGNTVSDQAPDQPLPNTGLYQAWPSWYPFAGYMDLGGVTSASNGLVNEGSYLWTFTGGGDNVASAGFSGSTADYAQPGYQYGGVFNMGFGSYWGQWNTTNNLLRSPLGSGHALTNVWSGKPHWYFHAMGMGETIGRSVVQSMNNTDDHYTPQSIGGIGNAANIHMGLMGDPTLRMNMVAPPSALTATAAGGTLQFNWTASTDPQVAGYHLYALDANGVPTLLNSSPVSATTWSVAGSYNTGTEFMVRAAKLETTPSGSYWNLSMGSMATLVAVDPWCLLHVKTMLGGAYDAGTGQMADALRGLSAFPLTEPYTALGAGMVPTGGGGGETTHSGVLSVSGNAAIVDWVLVELRSGTDPSQVVESRCGLVRRDGKVVLANNGSSPLKFLSQGQYRVAVRHRNHLGCMTAATVTLAPGVPATVDFTLPGTATYGSEARKEENGTMVLWPGNVRAGDHAVEYTGAGNDRDHILRAVGGGTPEGLLQGVYRSEDANLDGKISYKGVDSDRKWIIPYTIGTVYSDRRLEQLP